MSNRTAFVNRTLLLTLMVGLGVLAGSPKAVKTTGSVIAGLLLPTPAEATIECHGYCVNSSSSGCASAPELETGCKSWEDPETGGHCIWLYCE